MQDKDIVLIQGPPGTGKTRVITSIIKMLLSDETVDQDVKIQVCAPSNAAVDEILTRLIGCGLKENLNDPEIKLTSLIVRITAADFETSTNVQPFTLREQ